MDEMNLGEMIETSMKEIAKDKAREAIANTDTDEENNNDGESYDDLFNYDQGPISDKDYQEFFDMQ